uniref:FERM domain-containing protein n=1 Tax=Macrostomum lignano TaxID=282301 RepID=A0A1I8HGC6_9PLAT
RLTTEMTNDYRSVRFHLSYPRQASVLSWEECACLARSLGYRDNSLEQCYRQAIDAKYATEGFQLSQLDAFVGSKFFKSGFDFSFNSHSCEWNEQVVRRAVAVTAGKGMTFQQLYTTRIAYGLYESSDLRGLKAKPRTVMRALKACGRAISLGKMAHRVRHMKFHEPGRLQLDEFIDLALWAGPLDREEARCTLRPAEGRHEMVSFEEMLTPMDTRIQRRLDSEYRQEERQYVRETVRPAETRLCQCAVQAYRDKRLERSPNELRNAASGTQRVCSGAGARSSRATLRAASAAAAGRRESAYWTDSTDNEDELGTGNEENADSRRSFYATPSRFRLRRCRSCTLVKSLKTCRPCGRALSNGMPNVWRKRPQLLKSSEKLLRRSVELPERLRRDKRAKIDASSVWIEWRSWRFGRNPNSCPVTACVEFEVSALAAASESELDSRSGSRAPKQRQHRPVKKPIVDDENEEQWLEPRLGLVLPLRGPACRLSRLSYSRSCPPREHPVGISENLTTTNTSDEELASTVDLIQRVFYAKA